MKKLFLAGAVALMGAVTVNAQAKFGVKAGYALSTVDVKDSPLSLDAKSTFYVGGLVEYKVADKMAVQGEVLYSPMGAKKTLKAAGIEATTDLKLGTLSVPVSFKYYLVEGLAVNAGLNFGFLLNKEMKVDVSGSSNMINIEDLDIEEGNVDLKDEIKTLNLAPFIGAEYNLSNGLFVDARYNIGVTNLIKDAEGDGKLTNSALQVGLGYKF